MLADGNPADLFEAKGEGLWKQKRGPKNASLEQCDLGKGPGVVKGAFVELPRYFADTRRFRTWSRACVHLHGDPAGIQRAEIAKTPFGRGEQNNVTALTAYISAESKGMKFNLPHNTWRKKTMPTRWASACSSCAAGRTTFPVLPAMVKTASASACRTCPI
jgi:sulfur-oxidizing protein SoxA